MTSRKSPADVKISAPGKSYYDKNYGNYDRQNPPRKLRYYRRMLERFAAPRLPKKIHDIGCAFGSFLKTLPNEWEGYGTETNEFALQLARKQVPGARIERSNFSTDPFPGVKFSAVTAFDVLEHLPNLELVAKSVRRQLAVGGHFVFVVPVYDGLTGPIVRRLDRDPTHLNKWSRAEWLAWAEKHFEIVHWEGVTRYFFLWGYYLHWPTKFFRRNTPAILVVVKSRK